MKKLLLVLMVVSMLVVAGSAFAADEAGHGTTKTKPTINETTKKAASEAAAAAVDYAKAEIITKDATAAKDKVQELASTSSTLSFLKGLDTASIDLVSTENIGEAQKSMYAMTDTEQETMNKAAGADDSHALVEGAFVPKLDNLEDGKAYIVPIKIDAAAMGDANKFEPDEFILFPLGASKGKADKGYAVIDGDGNEIKPSDVVAEGWNKKAYLVFVFKADSELGIFLTSAPLTGLTPLLPALGTKSTTTDDSALKSSGGGCAMGTSALAFVVLGAFVAMRKK